MDGFWVEPLLELLDALLSTLEAWHSRAVAAVHEVHQNQYPILVLAEGVEALVEEFSELMEML